MGQGAGIYPSTRRAPARGRAVALVVVLVAVRLLGLATADEDRSAPVDAHLRDRWRAAAPDVYRIVVEGEIDGVGTSQRVDVVDGVAGPPSEGPGPDLSVDGLFALAEEAHGAGHEVTVELDDELGYPTRLRVDPDGKGKRGTVDLRVEHLAGRDRPAGCRAEEGAPTDLAAEPASWVLDGGYQRWEDADGCPVRVDVVSQRRGSDHCNWQGVTFLWIGRPLGASVEARGDDRVDTYLWDPTGSLAEDDRGRFDEVIDRDDLPAGVVDTGYRRGGAGLWLDPEARDAVYVVTRDRAQVWRRDVGPYFICA